MLQQSWTLKKWTNSSYQQKENIRKDKMGILELNIIIDMKPSLSKAYGKIKMIKMKRDLWDKHKSSDICVIRVPEGKEKESGDKKVFEKIIVENFKNLAKDINL